MLAIGQLELRPDDVGRAWFETGEARRDLELLWWVGRFRFVTAEAIAARFGVVVQRARARVRRLAAQGLLESFRARTGEPLLIYLTPAGNRLVGWPRRQPPRLDTQRVHERAVVALATRHELADERVLTERECRRLERVEGRRFSVEVPRSRRNEAARWPDLVLEHPEGSEAIEIELSPKPTERLRRIVAGYTKGPYAAVTFYAQLESVARRLTQVIEGEQAAMAWRALPDFRVQRWELAR